MEEYKLIQQMKDGDLSAFEKWMNVHSAKIELFAIQYGCTREQAGKVTEETFRIFYTDLANMNNKERLQYNLYQIALGKLVHIQLTDPLQDDILPFEEDKHLHEVIINLSGNVKVSLILSQFHNMNEGEIATIAGISTDTVKEAIAQAVKQLTVEIDNSILDKRLGYLQNSYERISLSFRKDQVFAARKEEIRKPDIMKQVISKKVLITWIIGLFALAALIIIPVVTGEEYQKTSAEKKIEQLKLSFEEEIASRYAQLGLIEKTEDYQRDSDYIPFGYGKQARQDFEMMIEREELIISETGKMNKKNIDKQYGQIIEQLALPSEMVEQLIKHPLTHDRDKSTEFITAYVKQLNNIQHSYSSIIFHHHPLIEAATVEGVVQIEKYLEKKESYPKELQNVLDNTEKQNLYLGSIPEWRSLVPSFSRNELSTKIKASIHKDLVGYIALLESSHYIASPMSIRSYDETIEDLLEIENTLLANVQVEIPNLSLRNYYSYLFYVMITDSEMNRINGSDGNIKKEVKSAWKKIASGGEKSPAAYIMKKITSEMEASEWTKSETKSRLNAFHLNYAIGLAREGNLDNFEMSGILQADIGFDIVSLPDPSFEKLIEETYKLYSANYDPAVLKNVHPLVILAMYYFANDNEDPETMWHLYIPEDDPRSLEAYLEGWEKVNINLNKVDGLLFDKGDGSLGFQRGDIVYLDVQMMVDGANGWKISYINLDPMDFE